MTSLVLLPAGAGGGGWAPAELLMSGSQDATVRWWDVGKALMGSSGGGGGAADCGPYACASLAPGGTLAAAAHGVRDPLGCWAVPSAEGEAPAGFEGASGAVQLLALPGPPAPPGAAGGGGPTVGAAGAGEAAGAGQLQGHPSPVSALAFAPALPGYGAAALLAVGCEAGEVAVWACSQQAQGQAQAGGGALGHQWERVATLQGHEGVVAGLGWSQGPWGAGAGGDGPALLLASCGGRGTVRAWRACAGRGGWTVSPVAEARARLAGGRFPCLAAVAAAALGQDMGDGGSAVVAVACPTEFAVRLLGVPSGQWLHGLPLGRLAAGLRYRTGLGVSTMRRGPDGGPQMRVGGVRSLLLSPCGRWLVAVTQVDAALRVWHRCH